MKNMLLFILLLAFAAATDIKKYKIPNLIIAFGIVAGIGITYISYGLGALCVSLFKSLIIMLLLYPFFLIKGLGAGDIKLLMLCPLYVPAFAIWNYIIYTVLFAGLFSALKMAVYDESRKRFLYLLGYAGKCLVTGTVDDYRIEYDDNPAVRRRSTIRLSIPALISAIVIYTGLI